MKNNFSNSSSEGVLNVKKDNNYNYDFGETRKYNESYNYDLVDNLNYHKEKDRRRKRREEDSRRKKNKYRKNDY